VQWLHDHAKAVQIVDIRDDIDSLTSDPTFNTEGGKKVLSKVGGYVPGALSVNFWAIRDKRDIDGHKVDFLLPTSSDFQAVMQASLLEADKPVVLVPTGDDASSLQEAAYLAYALQVFGMPADEVAILNGGTHAWIAAGYPVDTDAIAPMTSGHWVAKHADMKLVATTQQVLAASKHPGRPILVDARRISPVSACGPVPGHPALGGPVRTRSDDCLLQYGPIRREYLVHPDPTGGRPASPCVPRLDQRVVPFGLSNAGSARSGDRMSRQSKTTAPGAIE
jgi:thiosulfate/3-mercaptopyruvate sulfurtransferase